MLHRNTILKFIGGTMLCFIVFLFGFKSTGLNQGMSGLVKGVGQTFLGGKTGSNEMVKFRDADKSQGAVNADIEILFLKTDNNRPKGYPVSGSMVDSWIYATVPFLFLISLILATPVAWKERGKLLLFGMGGFLIFLLIKLKANILLESINLGWTQNGLWKSLKTIFELITTHTGFSLIMMVVIWMFLVIKPTHITQGLKFQK